MPDSARCPPHPTRRAALAALLVAPAGARAAASVRLPSLTQAGPANVLQLLRGSGLPLQSFGLHICPVDAAWPVATLNAESPFMLASTTKLVTSLAALDLLGPRYRWRTHAFITAAVEGGRLLGDLLITGGGNPLLTTAELRAWLQRLREQGLRDVRGDIVLDRSAFRLHEADHASTPEPAPDRPHHVRPDAFTLDEGVLHVSVQPARSRFADVHAVPPLAGVQMVNRVTMGGSGCRASARWSDDRGQPRLSVDGQWGAGCGQRDLTLVPPLDADVPQRAVASLWAEVGGRLGGRVRGGDLGFGGRDREQARLPLYGADGGALFPWSTHLSEPLPDVIREINKTSNNLAARHLMLSLSRGFPVRAATLPGAQEAVRGWLQRQGIAAGDITIENGSGLSRGERGKPRAMVQLLANAWRSREARSFLDSLPVAGVDGTLAHRMAHGYATGQAFLKTGTLFDTRALAGYVRGRSGRVYAVAALLNDRHAAQGRPALDAVIEWLARMG